MLEVGLVLAGVEGHLSRPLTDESSFPRAVAVNIAQVRRIVLSLPEVVEAPHHNYGSFRVRGKIFVTVPPDQEHLHVFVAELDREVALAVEPGFLEKLLWGGKVVGLRVALPRAKPSVVKSLIRKAWASKAPKSLSAMEAETVKADKS